LTVLRLLLAQEHEAAEAAKQQRGERHEQRAAARRDASGARARCGGAQPPLQPQQVAREVRHELRQQPEVPLQLA